MQSYRAIGLMSGSSLDGLDIVCCDFTNDAGRWSFNILASEVIPYPDEWLQELRRLPVASAKTFWEAHTALGSFFGEQVKHFIPRHKLKDVQLVASHGHTIFHFPEKHFTTQIGDGSAIAAKAGLPVVCDFRSADIAHGGQGTPIVPIGDLLLFADYKLCLNLGGIANISCKLPGKQKPIVAFDICPANQVLNSIAARLGHEYDNEGRSAGKGKINENLLTALNQLAYYQLPYPKSLDNSYSKENVLPLLEKFEASPQDKLRTFCEHIAVQIDAHIKVIGQTEHIQIQGNEKMLVTGGGAFNKFLIERLKAITGLDVQVPGEQLVKFKEAIVIALMGVLRQRSEINVLKSVTGASRDTTGGAVYLP